MKPKLIIKVSYMEGAMETFEATGMRMDAGVLSVQLDGSVVMIAPSVWRGVEIVEVEPDA